MKTTKININDIAIEGAKKVLGNSICGSSNFTFVLAFLSRKYHLNVMQAVELKKAIAAELGIIL